MRLIVNKTESLNGEAIIPASKSHTIRAVVIASLAHGISELKNPLHSEDTKAVINACSAMGARIEERFDSLIIEGFGARPKTPDRVLDMLNSGTSTNLILGILAALGVEAEITGDASLRSRPVTALAEALTALGCEIKFQEKFGCPPLKISGKVHKNKVSIDGSKSSQYISSLLIACPLLKQDTEVTVLNPTELPYIEMTLKWLEEQGIRLERDGFHWFKIFGNQGYTPIKKVIPADWSSAAFPICAAAVTDSDVLVKGIDINDVQGDKAIIEYLNQMGADIEIRENSIRVKGVKLQGRRLDINATPDTLPVLSVIGCFAEDSTGLGNVAQARVKETDRITVMCKELKKMSADIEELPDGVIIKKSRLKGANVQGHHDHRVVMALSIAGMIAEGVTIIDTAEAVSVTYPDYVKTMRQLGAEFELV
jgi:3-phosphoshikimate 1-carboxyvinyltransferase